jgi:TonB-dependent starch-binding outer membrane protein SusC
LNQICTNKNKQNMKKILLIFFVILGLTGSSLYAQDIRVTGTVTSSVDGSTLPGVTVAVEGTTQGTITDINGRYEITVGPNARLVFSFIGLTRQVVPVQGRNVVNVVLAPESAVLDEVVVVGYGTRLRSDLTGSVAQVRAADIANTTQPSFESAIQGKAAGVYVQGGSGKLGQAIKVRVRGATSISADSQPLYVVDGIPVNTSNIGTGGNEPINPMADLNPADIESIQILKDASAAAIYGARAANGVVLITTKRGREGRTNFNFSSQLGYSQPANKVGFLNREQYLNLFQEAFNNSWEREDGWFYGYEDYTEVLDDFFDHWRDESVDENWEDRALRNGFTQQYDLSASGGNDKTRFYTSLSWANQEAIVINNDFDRLSARLNLDHTANDVISFGMSLNPVRSRSFRVANDNAFATPLQMVALPPLDPAYDPETKELNPWTQYENGLIPAKYNSFDATTYRNIGNVYGNLNLLPGLQFRSEFGFDQTNLKEKGYWGRLTNDGGPFGSAEERTVMLYNMTFNNYFTFNQAFSDNFDLNLVLGHTIEDAYRDFQFNGAENFPSDHFKRISSASEPSSMTGSGTAYRFQAYFLRANMKFLNRYIVDVSGRYDGSSRFGSNYKYGFFPSAGVSWILSNEGFLADMDQLSLLKLRASWGVTGNAEIGNYAPRGLYSASNYAGYSGLVPVSLPSDDLKWETTTQFNVGLEFAVFNNRISGNLEYYQKNTEDLLLLVNVPSISGFTQRYENVGKMENKGVEFQIRTINVDRTLKWDTEFNIAFNKNEVTFLNGQIIRDGNHRAIEGEPIGIFWMPVFAGVDPDNGDALFYTDATRTETTNNIGAAEHQKAGDPNPDFMGGLTNTLRFGGFDFGFTFQFVYGNDIFNGGRQWQADGLSWFDNQTLDFYNNHWKQPGDNAKFPQPRLWEGNGYGVSSMLVFDGSYIRLKDITLGYTLRFPNAGVNSMRLFVRGLNVLTFTDYPGWDPEANFVGTGPSAQSYNLRQGYDFYTAPQPRTLTFGVQLGF